MTFEQTSEWDSHKTSLGQNGFQKKNSRYKILAAKIALEAKSNQRTGMTKGKSFSAM